MNEMLKKRIAFIYRLLLVAACATGVVLNLLYTKNYGRMFSYYTIQSNVLVLLAFGAILLGMPAGSRPYVVLKGMATMGILLTFLVYNLLLLPQMFAMETGYNFRSINDVLVHQVTPILALADYFLFDKKGDITWRDPLYWMCFPIAYVIYAFIYGALGGTFGAGSRVPYFFMDTAKFGVFGVALWCLGITAAFLAIAYAATCFDRVMGRRAKQSQAM